MMMMNGNGGGYGIPKRSDPSRELYKKCCGLDTALTQLEIAGVGIELLR